MNQFLPEIYMYLYLWWAICISFSILFITLIAVYVYVANKAKRKDEAIVTNRVARIGRNFVFVWALIGLLVFYLVSVLIVSITLFVIGNVIVEILLLIYLVKNRTKESDLESTQEKAEVNQN